MEIDGIGVTLRPRDTSEALDLGATLLRAHARAIYAAWLPLTLPFLAAGIALACVNATPWISLWLLWMAKPLFARVPLFVVSRAVFSRAPGWRETLRGVFAWRFAGLAGWLSLTRLDARRGIRQPLLYLEGLDRRERAARWRVFGRGLDRAAYAASSGCFAFEMLLALSVLLFVPLFVPTELWNGDVFDGLRWRSVPTPIGVAIVIAYYLGMSIGEPLYTATGFALYLDRRTRLEAWDIDLSFRRLRARLLAAAGTMALVLCLGIATLPAHAATTPPRRATGTVDALFAAPAPGADARTAQAAHAVFADPRFGGEHKRMGWAIRERFRPRDEPKNTPSRLHTELPVVGASVKGVLIAVLAAGVAWLAWYLVRHRRPGLAADAPDAGDVPSATALTDRDEPMPERLADAVLALWQAGDRRDALALLYRGTVERVAQRLDQPVRPQATEADAVAQARLLEGDASGHVIRIVRTWQVAAYAGRYPADDDLRRLLAGWPAA